MRHAILAVGIITIVFLVLLSFPSESRDEPRTIAPRVIEGQVVTDGHVCCEVQVSGKTKTCAASAGQTCEACEAFCESVR